MNSTIIVFPGSNCDRDIQVCLRDTFKVEPKMVWHRETNIEMTDLIVIPGGFSFGDYLRAGCIAAHSPAIREVIKHARTGVPVLGICNGFQILCETGILPGALMRNSNLRFICKDVHLQVENDEAFFTRNYHSGDVVKMPIAHHEGNYVADSETLCRIENDNRVAFRYCNNKGIKNKNTNPNGSAKNIAGILNDVGNVLGMMPHPERMVSKILGGSDGQHFFEKLAGKMLK